MANFGSLVVALNANIAGFSRSMGQAQSILGGFASQLRGLGAGLVLGGIGFGIASELQNFIEFEDAMIRVKAITGATAGEMQLLTDRVHQLARQSGIDQKSIWGVMLELGRANFNPKEINDVAEAVLNLSKATGSDTTRTGEIIGSMINAFSMSGGDAAMVADKLTVAANRSQTSVEELGDAMAYVGTIGKDIGVSMDETLAMMGVLGNFNIRGSMAGTSTRRLFTLMATDSQRLAGIFGESFTDINGNFVGITRAMQIMNEATADMAAPERLAKFNEAFGMLGVASASTLSGMVQQYSELKAAIEGGTGAALAQATEMESGVGGSLRRLMASWTEMKISMMSDWSETMIFMIDSATSASSQVAGVWDSFQVDLSAAFLKISVWWGWVWDNAADLLINAFGTMLLKVAEMGDTVWSVLSWVSDVAVTTAENIGDAYGTIIQNLIDNFIAMGSNLKEMFKSVWTYIKNLGKDHTLQFDFTPMKNVMDGMVQKELPEFARKTSAITDMIKAKTDAAFNNLAGDTLDERMNDAFNSLAKMQGGTIQPKPQWDPNKTPGFRGEKFEPSTTPAVKEAVQSSMPTAELGLKGTSKAYEIIMKARNNRQEKLLEEIAKNTAKAAAGTVRPGFTGEIAEGLFE